MGTIAVGANPIGVVAPIGDARFLGAPTGSQLTGPITGIEPTPTGRGFRLAGAGGAMFAFGDAEPPDGPGVPGLRQPIVGLSMARSVGAVVNP